MTSFTHRSLVLCLTTVLLSLIGTAGAITAQVVRTDDRYNPEEPTPLSVVIGMKAGIVVCSAQGVFPSVIIGNSQKGSGDIAQQFAQSGNGSRWGLAMLIPFSPVVGMSVDIGSLTYSAKYSGGAAVVPTEFTAQTFQLAFGAQVNVFSDSMSFVRGGGLRSVYLDGSIDIGLATTGNRVTAAFYTDSSANAVATTATGSFENNTAFRTLLGFRGAAGVRFAVNSHIELQIEASYTLPFNKVFSADAIRNNDFSVVNFAALGGVGYRF